MMYRNGNWKLCFSDSHISSYCIQDITDSRQRLALGTITGHIIIFLVKEGELIKSVDLNAIGQKIFAIHWADNSTLITCEREGVLKVWEFKLQEGLDSLEMVGTFVLPSCKERWTTSALLHKGYLICGDRMGSIHLYEMCLISMDANMPNHSLLKIHGSRGVSSLQYVNNSVMSAGRDGTVRRLDVDNGQLQLLSTDKLQMDWAAVIRHTKSFGTIVMGFHDVYFVIWSVVERRYLLKIDCRGGHRSWDYLVDEDCSSLKLAFVQNKDVHYFCNSISTIYNNSPLMGYHTKTINAGCILPILSSGNVVLLTGSEDTTLRTLRISNNTMKPDIILRNHVSSVRTVYSLLCSYDSTTYIFSAGGRGQMKVWKMSFDDKGETFAVELASHMVRCEKDIHRPWQKALPLPDPETRYMDLTVLEMCPPSLLIIAGCSDGMLRLLSFDTVTLQLKVTCIFEHHQHCILRVVHFKLKDTSMVVSMATDGKAAFWNVDEILASSQEEIVPFDHSLHSLGINSCAFQIQSGKLILSTGSDDTSICVNVFDFDNILKPNIVSSWSSTDLHSCQITGMCMTESFILTAALDQRVHLLKWKFGDRCLEVQPVRRFISHIPDIHGVLLWQSDCGRNKMKACIFGEGIQILSVNDEKMWEEITD